MLPIAHRGFWWPLRDLQDTIKAAGDAIQAGLGVELDIYLDPPLRVRHEPKGAAVNLNNFLDASNFYSSTANPLHPIYFWNIKQPGIEKDLIEALVGHGLARYSAIFDFELAGDKEMGVRIKDAAPDITVLARVSDRVGEGFTEAITAEWADGVWLDAFTKDWVNEETLGIARSHGKRTYVVSPELHNRLLPLGLWQDWCFADGVCTDFPHLLQRLREPQDKLHPKEPWW